VTETTVSTDLLQALEIVTELGSNTVGEDLAVLAIDNIALPVEEPRGNLVLEGVLDDGDDTLKLFGGEVTSALVQINIGLLADQVGVSATDTRDLGQGVHDLLLSIDVCVQQTDDVLEVGLLSGDERHDGGLSYVVDVVLSMLLQWEEFRSFSLASVGLPREMARAGVLTASGLRWQNHSAPLPTPCGKSEAPTCYVL